MTQEDWMRIAIEEAKAAAATDEVPVGAALVRGGEIVARAHNRCEELADPTQHAEMLVLQEGRRQLGTLDGCTLYVTLEPCAMCAGAMIHLRLPELVYGAFDARCGCCGSTVDLTDHWFYHSVKTWGGVLEQECAVLLKDFFAGKRCKPNGDRV